MDINSTCESQEFDQRLQDRLFAFENETRWIFGWNSWMKILKLRIFNDVPQSELIYEDESTLEENLQDFQASYETFKPLYSSDHVHELLLGLKIWRKVQRQSINLLSYTEHKFSEDGSPYKNFSDVRKIEIELGKKRLAETIETTNKKVEKYRSQLNSAAAQLKIQHQQKPIIDIAPLMTLVFNALFQKVDLVTDCTARSLFANQEKLNIKKSSRYLQIPELFKPLFVGRCDFPEDSNKDVPSHINSILEILQTGTEWYLAWTVFTEEILYQINTTLPDKVSRASLYENTVTNGQLALLKGLLMEVKNISDCNQKSAIKSFLAVLDCFINLLEKTKAECEFWIQNLDKFLTELGEEDVNDVSSGNYITHKLFILKDKVQHKNRHIHVSVLYLYKEINRAIDFVKSEFVGSDDYAALEGITSSLLDQYTENRKDKMGPVPHERNDTRYPHFEYPEDDDLSKPLGIPDEILAKMALDENYPITEENFWSDSASFDLDRNGPDEDECDAEVLRKMKFYAEQANPNLRNESDQKDGGVDEPSKEPQKPPKSNFSPHALYDLENMDKLYGGISPEIRLLVEDLNKRDDDEKSQEISQSVESEN